MAIIHVNSIDQAHLRVTCEDSGVLQELSEFFSFFAAGYQFSPAFKRRQWDGRIHLFNLRNQTLPAGLLHHLQKYADSRKHKLELAPGLWLPDLSEAESEASEGLYAATGADDKPLELRDYQKDAIDRAIKLQKILLVSPTGSGKSLIIYQLLRWYLNHLKGSSKKAIVIVPTRSLVLQMQNDFSNYSSEDASFDADSSISILMGGEDKDPKKEKVKVFLEDGSIRILSPNDIVSTRFGEKKAKDLTLKDDLI